VDWKQLERTNSVEFDNLTARIDKQTSYPQWLRENVKGICRNYRQVFSMQLKPGDGAIGCPSPCDALSSTLLKPKPINRNLSIP
jgi:hypothetical protein